MILLSNDLIFIQFIDSNTSGSDDNSEPVTGENRQGLLKVHLCNIKDLRFRF
jgi:hypothetical protein